MQMEEARSVIFAKEHNLGRQESENERLRAKCKLREREIQQKLELIKKLENAAAVSKERIENLVRDLKIATDDVKAREM